MGLALGEVELVQAAQERNSPTKSQRDAAGSQRESGREAYNADQKDRREETLKNHFDTF